MPLSKEQATQLLAQLEQLRLQFNAGIFENGKALSASLSALVPSTERNLCITAYNGVAAAFNAWTPVLRNAITTVSAQIPPPIVTTDLETRTRDCGTGFTGLITEQRTVTTTDGVPDDPPWSQTSNTCTAVPPPPPGHHHDDQHTHFDPIPDFGAHPTISSKQGGMWSDPATWDKGRIPIAGDVVKIKENHSVGYASVSDVAIKGLGIDGALVFSTSDNTRLRAGTTLVGRTGELSIGSLEIPVQAGVKAELVIANQPIDTVKDPSQYGTGLLSLGKFHAHGQEKTGWLRLAVEPLKGDMTLLLDSAPINWRAGDRLVIPDTRQTPLEYQQSTLPLVPIVMQIEEMVIASVDGALVTLTEPLKYDHLGARDSDDQQVTETWDGRTFKLFPHVGNLTRNVVLRSETTAGVRGHCLFAERSKIDIAYAAFVGLGRTTEKPLNNTVGTVIGTNQIGRYPIHIHHLSGPINPTNTGYQFSINGCVVEDGLKWSIAVHDSHFGYCGGNVIYGSTGAAIMTEEGNERENVFENNFAVKCGVIKKQRYEPVYGGVTGEGRPLAFKDFGWEGSAFWFNGNDNYVRGNVAANCGYAGLMYNGRSPSGFWFNSPKVPNFRGSDHTDAWTTYHNVPAPKIRECSNTEVYGSAVGAWISFAGSVGTVKNMLAWNIKQTGLYSGRNNDVYYDGLTLLAQQSVTNKNGYGQYNNGISWGATTYTLGHVRGRNIRVEGFTYGIPMPGNITPAHAFFPTMPKATILENVTLRNWVNIELPTPHNSSNNVVIRGLKCAQNHGPVINHLLLPQKPSINTTFEGDADGATLCLPARTLIYDYQVAGDNIEIFFPEQAPDFVMKKRSHATTKNNNCPTVGLTNQQCMVAHAVAYRGHVARCTDTRPEIRGFVCDIPEGDTFDSVIEALTG